MVGYESAGYSDGIVEKPLLGSCDELFVPDTRVVNQVKNGNLASDSVDQVSRTSGMDHVRM